MSQVTSHSCVLTIQPAGLLLSQGEIAAFCHIAEVRAGASPRLLRACGWPPEPLCRAVPDSKAVWLRQAVAVVLHVSSAQAEPVAVAAQPAGSTAALVLSQCTAVCLAAVPPAFRSHGHPEACFLLISIICTFSAIVASVARDHPVGQQHLLVALHAFVSNPAVDHGATHV